MGLSGRHSSPGGLDAGAWVAADGRPVLWRGYNVNLRCERLTRHMDETACDWCGAPVYVGETLYWSEEDGGAWCSRRCAVADVADGGGRIGLFSEMMDRLRGAK